MSERLWIQISDPDPEKSAWTGIITPPAKPRSSWAFEFVRPRKTLRTLYDDSPFKWGQPVTGLLDLQKDCTLLRTRVLNVGPGSFGVRIRAGRTVISGEFDALLRDLAIADPGAPCIAGVSFESEALGRWLDLPGVGPDRSKDGFVTLNPDASDVIAFDVSPWGRMTVRSTMVINDGVRQGAYRAATGVRLEFARSASLDEATRAAVGLERLFGFIVGFRGKFPPFRLWTDQTYQVGDLNLPLDGTLEVSGFDWQEGEPPSPHDCLSRQASSGVSLPEIVSRFAANPEDFTARMYAVEFARQFSKNLNDRFTTVVPLLESYLRRRYASPEEESYVAAKQAYFAWVDQAPDPDVRAFGRKHIRLDERGKAPSLPSLIERAIAHVNTAGFAFPRSLGRRIQERRAKLFHAPTAISEGDGAGFSADEKGATALLLLHTLEDLGIDIVPLATDPFAIRDVTWLFPAPRAADTGAPESPA